MIVGISIREVSFGFGVRDIPHSLGLDVGLLHQKAGKHLWEISGTAGTTDRDPSTLWLSLSTVEVPESEISRRDIPRSPCPFPRIALRTLRVASNELQYTEKT